MCIPYELEDRATPLIARGNWSAARDVLIEDLESMPANWKPVFSNSHSVYIAFWDVKEFVTYRDSLPADYDKTVIWTPDSYSRRWWQLAVATAELKNFVHAHFCIECGLELESDHPRLWIEKGLILNTLKRHSEALASYERASVVRSWISNADAARALRGQGAALIDLIDMGAAKKRFLKSLELEPENAVAKNELAYIEGLFFDQAKHLTGRSDD